MAITIVNFNSIKQKRKNINYRVGKLFKKQDVKKVAKSKYCKDRALEPKNLQRSTETKAP